MQTACWQSDLITLTAASEVKNPFLDVELTARFTGPNGESTETKQETIF